MIFQGQYVSSLTEEPLKPPFLKFQLLEACYSIVFLLNLVNMVKLLGCAVWNIMQDGVDMNNLICSMTVAQITDKDKKYNVNQQAHN